MSEKEIKQLIDLAKTLKSNISREKVLDSLISAGILDDKGEYTKHYDKLNDIVLESNVQYQK